MSNCILGSISYFGNRHSAGVCTRCGAIGVFLDGKLCAAFNEDGDEVVSIVTCMGFLQELPFTISPLEPDTLQVFREGALLFQMIERGEALHKHAPGL